MKQIWKRIGCTILMLCLVLTMMPTMAFAADAASLKSTIEGYSGGMGNLSAVVAGDTVTVTGTVTDATTTLTLDIDAGVTVVWQASITAASCSRLIGRSMSQVALRGQREMVWLFHGIYLQETSFT